MASAVGAARVLTIGHATRGAITAGRCTALLHRTRPQWKPGHTIKVARRWHEDAEGVRTRDEALEIEISSIDQMTLGDFTRAEAQRFGVKRSIDLCRLYLDSHDHGWRGELGYMLGDLVPSEELQAYWNDKHRGSEAWCSSFIGRVNHTPRLLAANSQYGYVDNPAQALTDAGEAIPEELQREYSTQARSSDMLARSAGRKASARKVAQIRLTVANQRSKPHITAADRRTFRKLDHLLAQQQAFLESDA